MVHCSKEGYDSLDRIAQGLGGLMRFLEDHAGNDLQGVPCYVISYHMRTLLMSIKGFSELLFLKYGNDKYGNDFPGDALEYLHYIRKASQKLEQLLVLGIERQLQSRKRCRPVVPVEDLVLNCRKIVRDKAALRNVELAAEVSPRAKAVMVRDVLLAETLTGLLLFAVEMAPAGGSEKSADFACSYYWQKMEEVNRSTERTEGKQDFLAGREEISITSPVFPIFAWAAVTSSQTLSISIMKNEPPHSLTAPCRITNRSEVIDSRLSGVPAKVDVAKTWGIGEPAGILRV